MLFWCFLGVHCAYFGLECGGMHCWDAGRLLFGGIFRMGFCRGSPHVSCVVCLVLGQFSDGFD